MKRHQVETRLAQMIAETELMIEAARKLTAQAAAMAADSGKARRAS